MKLLKLIKHFIKTGNCNVFYDMFNCFNVEFLKRQWSYNYPYFSKIKKTVKKYKTNTDEQLSNKQCILGYINMALLSSLDSRILHKEMTKNNAYAHILYGECLLRESSDLKIKYMKHIKIAALKLNNPFAMCALAKVIYQSVPSNNLEVINLYENACSLGYVGGYNNLAWCYEVGYSYNENIDKAYELYKKSLSFNNFDAYYTITCLCNTKKININKFLKDMKKNCSFNLRMSCTIMKYFAYNVPNSGFEYNIAFRLAYEWTKLVNVRRYLDQDMLVTQNTSGYGVKPMINTIYIGCIKNLLFIPED